jgi:hypothetical protein
MTVPLNFILLLRSYSRLPVKPCTMLLTVKRLGSTGISVILLSLFLGSCSKEESGSGNPDQEEIEVSRTSNSANTEAEAVFGGLFDDVLGVNNDVGIAGTGVFYSRMDTMTPVPPCYTVTIDHPGPSFFPVKITIDFGQTGCAGPDGRVRKGKVITTYSARLITPGAIANTVFENFYVDNVKVEGDLRITNTATQSSPDRTFKLEVIDGRLTWTNGNYTQWNSTRTITQVTGIQTPTPLDDIIKIEGAAQGQALRGNLLVAWQSSITEPLIRRFSCRYIVRGKISSARINNNTNNPWTAILDFGNGACDNQAVLTINGQSTQITLP